MQNVVVDMNLVTVSNICKRNGVFMERQWHIIPEYENIEKTLDLAKKYNAAFEYNDFFRPAIFENEDVLEERINFYKNLDRDKSKDTLHGIFLDLCIASQDTTIREYSKKRIVQSMKIGDRLGVKGVIFHTGLIGGLTVDYYINGWVNAAAQIFTELAKKYPHMMIYLENSFEFSPDAFLKLMEKVKDVPNVRICLDYGHAALTLTHLEDWVRQLAPYIAHMHVNDHDLKADLHLAPGEGQIDFGYFKELMERYNVNVSTLLEVNGIERQAKALEFMTLL